jgi:hypothetical protein
LAENFSWIYNSISGQGWKERENPIYIHYQSKAERQYPAEGARVKCILFFFFLMVEVLFICFQFNKNEIAFLFFWNFFNSFIHMCIHCFGSFLPLAPSRTLFPLPPSVPGRSCSAFISSFVEEKRQA